MKKIGMKKLIILAIGLLSVIPAVAQFDFGTTPDTIPDGGLRENLRDAVNWNITHNAADVDSLASHLLRIEILEDSSVIYSGYIQALNDSIGVLRDSADNFWADISQLMSDVGDNEDAILINNDSIEWLADTSRVHNERLLYLESLGLPVDHGSLTGLSGDDHLQYHNDSRADVWFTSKDLADLGTKSHTDLSDIGTNTHEQIDQELSDIADTLLIYRDSIDNLHFRTLGLLPSMSGNDGKYLKTQGDTLLWAAVSGGGGAGDTTYISLDTIAEFTSDHGVLIDGLLIKDGGIGYVDDSLQVFSDSIDSYYTLILNNQDSIAAHTDSIEDIKARIDAIELVGDSAWTSISTNTISEYTSTSGVSIDGVTLKDGGATFASGEEVYFDGGGDTYIYGGATNSIRFVNGGNALVRFDEYGISPNASRNKAIDLGYGTSEFFRNIRGVTYYVDSTDHTIYTSGDSLMFKDGANSGGLTLAELYAGSDSYTFENGLTESSGTVKLGGALAQSTTITASTANPFKVDVGGGTDLYFTMGTVAQMNYISGTGPDCLYDNLDFYHFVSVSRVG